MLGITLAIRVMKMYQISFSRSVSVPSLLPAARAARYLNMPRKAHNINLDTESARLKLNFPSRNKIIKSTQKSRCEVITINNIAININGMKLALLTWLMNISRIIL